MEGGSQASGVEHREQLGSMAKASVRMGRTEWARETLRVLRGQDLVTS